MPRAKPKQLPGLIITRVVSGGQTGVDRAALDTAIRLDIPHGGWCPRGRLAEDGRIPSAYLLRETESPEYVVRTEQNVIDSDGTLILYRERLQRGTLLTNRLAKNHGKPLMRVRLDQPLDVVEIHQWLEKHEIRVLNIAGPRESTHPGIYQDAATVLARVFSATPAATLFADTESPEDLT